MSMKCTGNCQFSWDNSTTLTALYLFITILRGMLLFILLQMIRIAKDPKFDGINWVWDYKQIEKAKTKLSHTVNAANYYILRSYSKGWFNKKITIFTKSPLELFLMLNWFLFRLLKANITEYFPIFPNKILSYPYNILAYTTRRVTNTHSNFKSWNIRKF